jgi:hypothetical protein
MSLQITSLSELAPEKVAAMVATMTQLMQERHPEVELTRGVFHDLVLYFNGLLNAAVQENIDRILASNSLLKITQNPTLSDATIVDQVLSNYNVARDNGTPATGFATFVFSTPYTTRLSTVGDFNVGGAIFKLNNTFTIVPNKEDVATDTDRAMLEVGDGTYVVTLPMTATTVGVAGNIKRGVTINANFTPDNVLRVFAASDFIGGREASTNADYLKKLSNGLAAKTIGGRKSYDAFIRAQKSFENILHVSVLGCGDPEQQRDQHSLFPVSGGGKIDVYVQTHTNAQETDHNVQATFVRKTSNGTLWQIILPRDIAPGFYDVTKILPPPTNAATQNTTTGSYEIVEDIRGVDLLSTPYVADIQTVPEGAYTRYQTSVIRFEDTDKIGENLIPNRSTAFYTLTTRGLPLVGDIHDFLTSRDNRARGTDILVKAAVPCFTKISFALQTDANDYIADDVILSIKKEVVAAIANVGFSEQLHAAIISAAAHKFLTGRQVVNSIDMFGKIRRPDGSVFYLRDNTLLTIPTDPLRMVTGRTTVFLTGLEDVEITRVTSGYTN